MPLTLANPRPSAPLLVHSTIPLVLVDESCRLDPLALLPQALERQLPRRLDELLLRVGHLGGDLSDLACLHF
jgi:hypothetical protein